MVILLEGTAEKTSDATGAVTKWFKAGKWCRCLRVWPSGRRVLKDEAEAADTTFSVE